MISDPETPSIFLPFGLRSGLKFKNLSNHEFSKVETRWLQKQFISADGTVRGTRSTTEFCEKYQLSEEKLQRLLEAATVDDFTKRNQHQTSHSSPQTNQP
jgi:hypothetical protein